jgi:predicted RNase H-like nuclease (RuvC/YqgF family)
MTKKNLSNLIQEESTKFTPFPDEPIIEIIAEAVLEPKVQTPKAPTPAIKNQSEVEAIIKEMQKTVESNLTKQISDLQIAVSEKEALAERLTQELHETKQTALQLADSNFQLLEEIKFLKQPYQQPSPQSSQISKSIQYKKSHRSIERLQEKPSQDSEDFSKNTWLYD